MKSNTDIPKLLLFMLICSTVYPQQFSFHGQLSSWGTVNLNNPKSEILGLRYLPTFTTGKTLYKDYFFDIESSLHAYSYGIFQGKNNSELNYKLKFYRFWFRISSSQFDLRMGLQKINFGSAILLRPLMWFERMDPRDPLRLTDGVYGALFRYYFLNNTNIWLWGLLGNSRIKGWEFIATDKKQPEYGGRIQLPFLKGELALTYHHRQLDLEETLFQIYPSYEGASPEDRFSVDGKWNAEVGIWSELTIIKQKSPYISLPYRKLITIGVDYTFGIGNGIQVVGEYFIQQSSKGLLKKGEDVTVSALSGNYPVGLLDKINAILYSDWQHKNWYRFLSWQRTYDNFQIYLIGFWNPEQFQIYQNLPEQTLFAGKGFQLMVVLNH